MPPVIDLPDVVLVSSEDVAPGIRSPVNARTRLRRAIDIGISLLILTLSAPMLAMVIIAIRLESPGPILFRQKRVGHLGRAFRMYKFRTMKWDPTAYRPGDALPPLYKDNDRKSAHDARVTRVGFHLRRWSVDELPNLLNVLRGEMTLVGPRPTGWAPEFYGDAFSSVMSVKPGVTGLWQVMGRGNLTFEERVALDYEYVRTRSIRMDVWILFKTIGAVLSRRGAY
jgi:lipopolysaccharide/colanic/teichoic acid biosynthesis glycosyltransferase